MIDVSMRAASAADFEAVDRLHAASVRALASAHYDPETIAQWSSPLDPDLFAKAIVETVYRVAESDEGIVGFGQLDVEAAEIKMLYVDPRWSGGGVGRELLSNLEKVAREHGLERLVLRSSLNAEEFYRRAGWRSDSRTMHALRGGLEAPCVWMSKELGPVRRGTNSG